MSQPVGQGGNLPPVTPSCDIPALSRQLQNQLQYFAQDLHQLMDKPGLSDDPQFISQVHHHVDAMQACVKSVKEALGQTYA